MKINRLMEITIILLNKGTVTAKELAERFEVSARTIYRDIDVLSSAGVPVFTNKGNGGGISLLENYSLNKALISENESESMLLALKTLQAIKYPEIDMIMDKLGSLFKSIPADDWVEVDFTPWGSNPNSYNKFSDIKKAILGRRVIGFEYMNSFNKKSIRQLEPMKLFFKGLSWYLCGYCRQKHDFRTFRITRMKKLVITDELFTRRNFPQQDENRNKQDIEGSDGNEGKQNKAYKEHKEKIQQGNAVRDGKQDDKSRHKKNIVNLKLKFQPEVLYRLYDDFDEEYLTKQEDGNYIVDIAFPEDEWVYGYIMSFGCYVEVLQPIHIRKIILERLKKVLEFYEN